MREIKNKNKIDQHTIMTCDMKVCNDTFVLIQGNQRPQNWQSFSNSKRMIDFCPGCANNLLKDAPINTDIKYT